MAAGGFGGMVLLRRSDVADSICFAYHKGHSMGYEIGTIGKTQKTFKTVISGCGLEKRPE